jgi:MFS family permease
MLNFGISEYLITFVLIRSLSFISLLLDPIEKIQIKELKWIQVIKTQGFGYFLFSWLMFNTAGALAVFLKSWIETSLEYLFITQFEQLFQYVGVALSAIFSGFFSDYFGRKKTIVFGLSTLGISYTFFAIVTNPFAYLLTRILYGIAWGILMVNYYLTVIGDLSRKGSREKFFTLGGVITFNLFMIGDILGRVYSLDIPPTIISVFLSVILYTSIIPVLYAPETLPLKIQEKRKRTKHIEEIKKLIEEEKK